MSREVAIKLWGLQPIRYVIAGGMAFVLEMATIYALHNFIGFGPLESVAISFWVGLVTAFLLQKIMTFGDRRRDKKTLAIQSTGYLALVGLNYLFTLAFVSFTVSLIGVYAARTIAILLTTVWNFLAYKKLFRSV